jgi:hypothetical protein
MGQSSEYPLPKGVDNSTDVRGWKNWVCMRTANNKS